MATTKERYFEFPAGENFTSDWIVLDNYSSTFNLSSVMINWHGITAETKDGEITLEITNKPDDADFVTVADTINVNSASNVTNNEFRQLGYTIKAFRIKYAKNSISGEGTIKINIAGN